MSRSRKSVGIVLLVVMALTVLPVSSFAEGFLTLEKTHKYLGFSTIALVAATAATKPSGIDDVDTHESLAYATAAVALSTVLTGYLEHRDRFDLSEGFFTKENMHIMAGTVGALMLTTGVLMAADSYVEKEGGYEIDSHAGLAIAGGALMTIAIIDIEW